MAIFSAVRLVLTLSCEESTRLVSTSCDRGLDPAESWALRLHVLVCRSCRRFRRQILFLRKAVRIRSRTVSVNDDFGDNATKLSAEARQRILQSVIRKENDE